MRIEYNLALYYDRDKEFRPVHVRRKRGYIMENQTESNIERLADYINSQENPKKFAYALFSLCKPRTDDFPDRNKETEIAIR